MSDVREKLIDITNEGYINLSKWLITLATGTIVFSIKLISSSTNLFFKSLLTFGLGLLLISIILGVRYVRLRLDGTHFNYVYLEARHRLENNLETDRVELEKKMKEAVKKMKEIGDIVFDLFSWQEKLFYAGLVIVGVFGIYNV